MLKVDNKNTWYVVSGIVSFFLAVLIGLFVFCSCTITLQNTSSNGTASDLVDDNFKNDPVVSPDISVPLSI